MVFVTHGLPWKVVTDNGHSFTSEEFCTFMSENGITHVTTAPYHPSSNGLAERAVQTVKCGLKATKGDSLQERLSKFLFTYCITSQMTTGIPPAQLLMNCRLRSRFDGICFRIYNNMSRRSRPNRQFPTTISSCYRASRLETLFTQKICPLPL